MNESFSLTPALVIFFLWQALQGLLLWVLSRGTAIVTKSLSDISRELNILNQHFAALETWREQHDKRDDDRFGEQHRRLVVLESRAARDP